MSITKAQTIIVIAIGLLTSVAIGVFAINQPAPAVESPKKVEKAPTLTIYQQGAPDVTEIVELVNTERAKIGVKLLIVDQRLIKSAQQKADDMNTRNYNAHIDPDGRQGYDIAHEYAPDICTQPVENLYWGTSENNPSTSQGVINGWMLSKPHREGLLKSDSTYVGVGVSATKVVTHFC